MKIPFFPFNDWMPFNLLKRFSKSDLKVSSPSCSFSQKYAYFKYLLSKNNTALEIMADMEERQSGESAFDMCYIKSAIKSISEAVKEAINSLNALSGGKYNALFSRFDSIDSELKEFLFCRKEFPPDLYTIPIEQIRKGLLCGVGGKNAHLGEVRNCLNLPTPKGFAITTSAYKNFIAHNDLTEKINEKLSQLSGESLEDIKSVSKEIQEMIKRAEMPGELANAIKEVVDSFHPSLDVSFAVRSSALHEDGDFTFAGQYSSYLNVPAEQIIQKYKEVLASLFEPRALFYYKDKGFEEGEMVMSVGVFEMIDAKAAGVMYSNDPNNPQKKTIIISSVKGLGKCIVEGMVTPEFYAVSKFPDFSIIEKNIPEQKIMCILKSDGDAEAISTGEMQKGKPSLTDDEVKALAKYAIAIENHYKCPQDIEWAISKTGQPFILQTRPLKILEQKAALSVPDHVSGYRILMEKGVIACKGIGFGPAFHVRNDDDLNRFPDGAILIARHTSPKFVIVMKKARAIVTDVGSATGHAASLAREFGIPALLDTEIVTTAIKEGQEITVDAYNSKIYDGRVKELMKFAEQEAPFQRTETFHILQKASKLIVPLNLLDPSAEGFKEENCLTFHDIIRFCHEKSMHEMFKVGETTTDAKEKAKRFIAGIPASIFIIDLGGGVKESTKKLLPKHIFSIPFNAFYKGLISMKWPGPKPVDTKGFLAMIANTASIPEYEIKETGKDSFAFISREYMNFSIRLGYHLSTIEAFAGENVNDNYIRFFFKGGGAARERRLRRVRLIAEILKKLDFSSIKILDDLIDASLAKYKISSIEKRLELLGKLTVYTKQLDMVMYNDAITDWYIEEFEKEHINIYD